MRLYAWRSNHPTTPIRTRVYEFNPLRTSPGRGREVAAATSWASRPSDIGSLWKLIMKVVGYGRCSTHACSHGSRGRLTGRQERVGRPQPELDG